MQTHTKQEKTLPCFAGLFLKGISSKAHLGISARNSETHVTDLEVEAIKIINNDMNAPAYKPDPAQNVQAEGGRQKAPSKMQYTDQMDQEATDIFDAYAQQEAMLNNYINEYAGNVRKNDDMATVLFKMNEHIKHVNSALNRYVHLEAGMS
jgi:hypothetical protein